VTGIVGRLVARLHGEVAGHALDSYRRAGLQVFELADRLEEVRAEVLVAGSASLPTAVRLARLCGWNAFALQTVGDALLAEDEARWPLTSGFLPRPFADEALGVYGPVAGWLSRAQQALHNEHYELDVTVPVSLPPWATSGVRFEDDDPEVAGSYRRALLSALERLEAQADRWALSTDPRASGDGEQAKRARGIVRQVRAEVATARAYAAALCGGRPGMPDGEVGADVEAQVKLALERLFVYGQLVADPSLALAPLPKPSVLARAGRSAPLPRPGEPGFDPWCLTDPRRSSLFKAELVARHDVRTMWSRDPDPARTLALKADIDRALVLNRVGYGVGHFHACPWSAIYVAKQPLRLGRASLHPLQEFTLTIDWSGRRFRRAIEVGPFHPE
jgi:hypothetical protein